jgi:hypothetical protein
VTSASLPVKLPDALSLEQDRRVVSGTTHILDGQSEKLAARVAHLLPLFFATEGQVPGFDRDLFPGHFLTREAHCGSDETFLWRGQGGGLLAMQPSQELAGPESPVPARRSEVGNRARIGPTS